MDDEDKFDLLVSHVGQAIDAAKVLRLNHAVYLLRMAILEISEFAPHRAVELARERRKTH